MNSGKINDEHIANKNNCWGCKFFGITHEKNFPYKCDAMRFKSRQLPCDVVVGVEGDICLSFLKK
tara:strand:+ start:582 stop:776 length:195 start_codon:yes stop_codon:yes gene_type:complete